MRRLPLDRAWPGLPLLFLALAAVVALVGIIAAPTPTDAERIEGTLHDFAGALQERRGEDACALLTPAAQRTATARTGTLDCPATARSFGLGIDPAPLRTARVTGVQVAGGRATIAREQLLVSDGEPFGGVTTLEHIDGRWRIATLP